MARPHTGETLRSRRSALVMRRARFRFRSLGAQDSFFTGVDNAQAAWDEFNGICH